MQYSPLPQVLAPHTTSAQYDAGIGCASIRLHFPFWQLSTLQNWHSSVHGVGLQNAPSTVQASSDRVSVEHDGSFLSVEVSFEPASLVVVTVLASPPVDVPAFVAPVLALALASPFVLPCAGDSSIVAPHAMTEREARKEAVMMVRIVARQSTLRAETRCWGFPRYA